jgi:hypothetical protein
LNNLIILTISTSLLIIGFIYYIYSYENTTKDIWDYVPENAVAVYDTPDFVRSYKEVHALEIGSGLSQLSFFDNILQLLFSSDSTSIEIDANQELKNIQTLISIHTVAKEELDAIYYVNISQEKVSEVLQGRINEFIKDTESVLSYREYSEFKISEISGDEFQISYFISKGILVISTTSFLIEDVIRTIGSDEGLKFRDIHGVSIKANKLKNDQGDIYINTQKIIPLLGVFGSELTLKGLANSTFLDVKMADNLLSLSGFTYTVKNNLLSAMINQEPIELSIKNYVPNTAYSVMHTGISDADVWYKNYTNLMGISDLKGIWNTERMTRWMGDELALVKLNSRKNQLKGNLLFIETKDINEALNQFNVLSETSSVNLKDTVYYENYGGYIIKELNVSEFPELLFGSVYSGFSQSYYCIIDKYLILASEIAHMHTLINSIEQENTWGRSITKSQWLSHTLEEASVSYFFDYSQSKERLKESLNDTWQKHLVFNENILKGVGMGAIQFSSIDGQFYTSAMVEYDLEKTRVEPLNFEVENTTYLYKGARTKPFVIKNHNSPQTREVFVQDSLNNIYLIDNNGAVVWQDSISQNIIGQLYQIDYYKNKKLQYLFAAGQKIYLIDRNGENVEGYPIDVGYQIDNLALFDYEHIKDYRILVGDRKSNLLMYDKEGNMIEGWKSDNIGEDILETPRHVRVRGKDVIVTVHTNGRINLTNRRGDKYSGFPLDLKNDISGDLHIEVGSNFDNTIMSVISRDGELVEVNLNGETVNKQQLYKPTKDTFFKLVEGVTKNDFVIMRQNNFRLSLLDEYENTIMEKDYLTIDSRDLQYYDLGGLNTIYVVNEYKKRIGNIYDYEGKPLNNVPINNGHEIGLLKNTKMNKTYIYSVYKDQVNMYSF